MKQTRKNSPMIRKRKMILYLIGLIIVMIGADMYISHRQDEVIRAKEEKIRRLEEQAFRLISVDIRDITETGSIADTGQYDAVLRIDNVGDEPAYLSHPLVKAYIQTGTISWTEVPVEDKVGERQEQVYKIDQGTILFRKTLTVSRGLPYNRYLIPKYMHVRFYIVMYVLPESGFKEGEVVERRSDSYIYLKPYWVSQREISQAIDFGKTKIPTYMPISAFRNWNKVN